MQKSFYLMMLTFLLTSACVKEKPPFKFPQNLAQVWTISEESEIPMSAAPQSLIALSFKKAWRASYKGPGGVLNSMVYEAPAEAVAFEAAQKWRSEVGQMAFHTGSYFVILDGSNLGDASLGMLLKELESAVAAGRK